MVTIERFTVIRLVKLTKVVGCQQISNKAKAKEIVEMRKHRIAARSGNSYVSKQQVKELKVNPKVMVCNDRMSESSSPQVSHEQIQALLNSLMTNSLMTGTAKDTNISMSIKTVKEFPNFIENKGIETYLIKYEITIDMADIETGIAKQKTLRFSISWRSGIEDIHIAQEKISLFVAQVISPSIKKMFKSAAKLHELNDEMEESWVARMFEAFPHYRSEDEQRQEKEWLWDIMGNVYFDIEIILNELVLEIEKEKENQKYKDDSIVHSAEALELVELCRHIITYTEYGGKDIVADGVVVGKLLISKHKETALECNTFFKRVLLTGITVELKEDGNYCINCLINYSQFFNQIKFLIEDLKTNYSKFLKPRRIKTTLTLEVRQQVMNEIIGDGCPNYLELQCDGHQIATWKDRVKMLNDTAKQEINDSNKKCTYNLYKEWMKKASTFFQEGGYGNSLKNHYNPEDILQAGCGDKKTWSQWYTEILKLSKAGASSEKLDSFFRTLKNYNTAVVREMEYC